VGEDLAVELAVEAGGAEDPAAVGGACCALREPDDGVGIVQLRILLGFALAMLHSG